MEYLLQLLIEKIENSENQWKPGQLGKGRVCQFVHAVPPPPFVVRHLSYGTAGRISSTSLKIF